MKGRDAKSGRTSETYRLKAADCAARAAAAIDPATRTNYHEFADYWNDMAHEARDAEILGRPVRGRDLRPSRPPESA